MISISMFMLGFVAIVLVAWAVIELTDDKPIPAWMVKLLKIPEEDEK